MMKTWQADWRERSEISGDVVAFSYVSRGLEQGVQEVFVWDLDKTYLDTAIETAWQLLTTAIERAFSKKNIPGTKALLQALSKYHSDNLGRQRFPVYFITASPPQMEARIFEKFEIDGIKPWGCFYKDNLRNLHPRRLWRLKKQVGYKIQALLQLRARLGSQVRQIFWGDDSESDAIIYNLYSDICSRRLEPQTLRGVLKELSVTNEQIDMILHLQGQVPQGDPVDRIYINLAADTDPDYYLKFGRRTLATYNSFQIAIDLYQDGRLGLEQVHAVSQDMIFNYGFTPDELTRSFDDLVRRQVVGETCAQRILEFAAAKGLFYQGYSPSLTPSKEVKVSEGHVYELEGHFEPWIPERIDYLHDYR
jgi:hypothetical protein